LRDRESVFAAIFHCFELWWNWSVKIADGVVHGKVHELDLELVLNLGLRLNAIFHYNAHLFDGVHFGFLGHINPVIKLFVEVDGLSAALFKVLKSPVADLDKSES
jgi:hypothetical protein